MIGRMVNKKSILIFLLIIVSFFIASIVMVRAVGIGLFYKVGKKENQENKIAVKYRNSEFRHNYFYENKEYFNNLVSILEKEEHIYEITYNGFCKDYSYKREKVLICSRGKIDEFQVTQIIKNFKELELSSILFDNDKIIFRKVNTPEFRVWFNFCRNVDDCSNKNEFFEESYGISEENIIDKYWSSYYSDIPTM